VLDVKAATSTIPIVAAFGAPIELGIVPNLARPGGNITGVTTDAGVGVDVSGGGDIWAKRIQLLKEAVPQITRLGTLATRNFRDERFSAKAREDALKNAVSFVGPPLEHPTDEQEYRRVFSALAQEGADGLLVSDDPENILYRGLIAELAAKGRLPTICPYRQYVEAGGLMSYGIDISDLGHRVADLTDKILKGAKPGEIPHFPTDPLRVDHQSEDRKDTWDRTAAIAGRPLAGRRTPLMNSCARRNRTTPSWCRPTGATIRGFLLFWRRSVGSISSSIQSATRTSGRVSTRRLSRVLTLLDIWSRRGSKA
jgi:hypothetical protein